jgi:hypothetical protein
VRSQTKNKVNKNFVDVSAGAVDSILGMAGMPIPLATIFLSATRGRQNRNEELEIKKVKLFLDELAKATNDKQDEFVNNLRSKGKVGEWGDTILLILSQMDHMDKPRIVGKIFRACMEQYIEYNDALRLATIINGIYVGDIKYLNSFEVGDRREFAVDGPDSDIAATLAAAGLLTVVEINCGSISDDGPGASNTYVLSSRGEFLKRHAF